MNKKEYWMRQLEKMDGNPLIPWPEKPKKEDTMKQYEITLNQETVEKIRYITRDNDMLTFIFLLASVKVLLWKFTNQKIINVFVPSNLSTDTTNQLNKYVPIIDEIREKESFKTLLAQVKNTVFDGYENQLYPIEEILQEKEEAHQKVYHEAGIFMIYKELHDVCDVKYAQDDSTNQCVFMFLKDEEKLKLNFTYRGSVSEYEVSSFLNSYMNIIDHIVSHGDDLICKIPLLDDEKLHSPEILCTNLEYSGEDFLERLQNVTEQEPNHVAIYASVNIEDILIELESNKDNEDMYKRLGTCCFTRCRYSFVKEIKHKDKVRYFVKLYNNRCCYINHEMYLFLECMQGEENLFSMFEYVTDSRVDLAVQVTEQSNYETTSIEYNGGTEEATYQKFINFIKEIYKLELIQLSGVNESKIAPVNKSIPKDTAIEVEDEGQSTVEEKIDILLIGDTPGIPTVGILYLASYLVRNGVKAKCLMNEKSRQSEILTETIVNVIRRYQPQYVGVSMKWFPHIYRVLEICKIVKEYFPEIKVIVGGDTASYFYHDIIKFESVDYIIRGDGEIPLLEICKGNMKAPNIVYMKDQVEISNPVTYIQNEKNTNDVYLSDLSKVLISKEDLLNGTTYIYTHKGCSMNCIYCGGGKSVQKEIFQREKTYIRNPHIVRNDIAAMKEYCSTFLLDFDYITDHQLEYCKAMLDDVDVSKHFCVIFSMVIPSEEVIEYISSKFMYVRWNLDVCSLSKRHRDMLQEKRLVKKQPNDEEIFHFFEVCERYDNCHVDINMVLGLPYFTEDDIAENKKVIQIIVQEFSCFNEMNWGRLHAQPGTYIASHAKEFQMISFASSFEDFYRYSKMNYERKPEYPTLNDYTYPYILYENAELNTQISKYYQEMMQYMMDQKKLRRRKRFLFDQISYADLNVQSDKIAQGLMEANVKPGDIVIVYMKNPIHAAVAMIGVMKSQAVYLPIDEASTDLRIQSIIQDSKAEFMITDMACPVQIKKLISFDTLLLADKKFELTLEKSNQEKPVYIIYTSGSAGTPKGVNVRRKSLNNLIQWRTKEYRFQKSNRTLQILSYAFDAFYGDFYCSLATGGSIYIVDKAHKCDPVALSILIHQEKITNLSVLPTFYHQLLNEAEGNYLNSLEFVVLGGEKPSKNTIERSKKLLNRTLLINEYGPTEATITTTYHMDIDENHPAILGRPIANMNVAILNSDGNHMPKGLMGELCITGIGLAEGYLNQETLTSEKFQKYPYGVDTIMYRTGDLAYYNLDGEIEISGRIDSQVKVAGYRIECSEIEMILQSIDEVKEAVVIAKETSREMKQLIAFITCYDKEVDIKHIKDELSEYLPEYMIPTRFVLMGELPRTVNGKYDRRALEDYRLTNFQETQKKNANNSLEESILNIWKEVLKTDTIGVCDNFFDNGGNSILLMQVYHELQNKIIKDITITDLFAYPTVQLLAEYIEERIKNQ